MPATPSTTPLDTTKVTGRRTLRFETMDDIQADVESLAQAKAIRSLGNWSPGQIFKHLALTMKIAVDGAPPVMPKMVIVLLSWFFKRKFLTTPMRAGFKLPKSAQNLLPPDPTPTDEGLRLLRETIGQFKNLVECHPSPFLGKLTKDEWTQLQCRHAELHLSFLVPEAA